MKKHKITAQIEKNGLVDKGDGLVQFPSGLVITDNSVQRNGTQYDIQSMVLDEYKGQVTADHMDMLQAVIGKVQGLRKTDNSIIVEAIKFAVKENALAKLAYDLITAPEQYVTDFSIETYGPAPDEDGVYYGARLVGLSAVVVGNNKSAYVNDVAMNSIRQSKEQGLDTTEIEKIYNKVDESSNSDTKRKESKKMSEVKTPEKKVESAPESKTQNGLDLNSIKEAIGEGVKAAVAPIQAELEEMKKNSAKKAKVTEPAFSKSTNTNGAPLAGAAGTKSELESLSPEERTVEQIENARQMLKSHSQTAAKRLNDINLFHLDQLKATKDKNGSPLVKNSMTIADFGNFVMNPEQLTEIQGCRNDYTGLINESRWVETMSTVMGWLERVGDINMESVEFCDDDADGNLKPVSEYSATPRTSNLEELAAVTPVCNAATRFVAADILGDIAAGYRSDYDRKRAQLVIARLEQAVEYNGNSVSYATTSGKAALMSWLDMFGEVADCTENGVYILSSRSLVELKKQILNAGGSDVFNQIFFKGADGVPTIDGHRYITVPSDLLPTLNSAETKVFTVNGVNVTVNHAVFYVDLSQNFSGRTSGGLQYDLSVDAAYEVSSTVKSAFQRNEVVLRGSFFRGGQVLDRGQVSGLLSPGVS